MKHVDFGLRLRELLTSLDLGRGHNRWFREHVGEDRALRRWLSGKHFPSPDNWKLFADALKKGREGDSAFLKKLVELQEQLLEGQAKLAANQRRASSFGPKGRRPAVSEPELYSRKAALDERDQDEEELGTDVIRKPKDPVQLQRLWNTLTSTSLHR